MRDLRKDLETCNQATPGPWKCLDDTPVDTEWASIFPQDLDFVMNAREGWPHAIERAIKAEAENAKLRKVVDAAREYMTVFNETPGYYESLDECVRLKEVLRQALADLDEEGTK